MEEQQIRDFVHRVSQDATLRQALASHPEEVVKQEHFTPKVAQIVLRLVPHLTMDQYSLIPMDWWQH